MNGIGVLNSKLAVAFSACVWLVGWSELRANPQEWWGREPTPAVVNPAVRSEHRPWLSLDGQWQFATDPQNRGRDEGWFRPEVPLPGARPIRVPGCWEAQGVGEPGLSHGRPGLAREPVNLRLRSAYTGPAWYKRRFKMPKDWAGRQIWLKIGGVNSIGWFWLNGRFVGKLHTYCGTYKYNVTDLVQPGREAVLAALVRNDVPSRRGEVNSPRCIGGLIRSVELEATPPLLIDWAWAEPRLDEKKVRIHLTVRNAVGRKPTEPYTVEVQVRGAKDGNLAGKARQTVSLTMAVTQEFSIDVPLEPCIAWSPENPYLYVADIVLLRAGRPIDGWAERFGVRKFEVRGGDLYLNNHRYFLRGAGDDSMYPFTICSPASREEHIRHLRIARQYGFNYVRLHTHCELPEYFEAADEVGIMVQPELPYYGRFHRFAYYMHMSCAEVTPLDDLLELVTHYRRYTSLATYCSGNEGTCPSPLDRLLYHSAKWLDPSRPWICQDGGQNSSPQNSDINSYFDWRDGQVHIPLESNDRPRIKHEYMSLGLNEDPRLESKFTGPVLPNLRLADVKAYVTGKVGLDWSWAEACFDAGYRLQAAWHKIGIESARADPYLDGFLCWLMVDLSPSTQNGVLNMFWEKKWSTPEWFRQFNSPTVVLACAGSGDRPRPISLDPKWLNLTAGQTIELRWLVSHFQDQPIERAVLRWRLTAGKDQLAGGEIKDVSLKPGEVKIVGTSRIVVPAVSKPVLASLTVELPAADTSNSWRLRLYPRSKPDRSLGQELAASASVFDFVARRYPGAVRLDEPEAAKRPVVVAGSIWEKGVVASLRAGKRVVCLSLPGFALLRPGTRLGWWAVSNQSGTALADHPAWGDFPHDGCLDPDMFRLVDTAEKLDPGHKLRNVEPLMVGIGRRTPYRFGQSSYPLGFNLYVFQARVGPGRLLASGLNLRSDAPEAVCLLDQFLRYACSDRFRPQGKLDPAVLESRSKQIKALYSSLNGWRRTIKTTEWCTWPSFLGWEQPMAVVRQTDGRSEVVWETGPGRPDKAGRVHFRWMANLGWRSQPAGGRFSLFLADRKLLDFDITLRSTVWKSADGSVELHYTVKSIDRNEDSSGIMELVVPASLVPAGVGPVRLRVVGSAGGSRRYFGLFEVP